MSTAAGRLVDLGPYVDDLRALQASMARDDAPEGGLVIPAGIVRLPRGHFAAIFDCIERGNLVFARAEPHPTAAQPREGLI